MKKLSVLIGRIMFSWVFIESAPVQFKAATIAHVSEQGFPLAALAVPLSGALAMVGGVSVALGLKARWGAWCLVLFLVPVTLVMHRFWGLSDPQAAHLQYVMFLRNVSMLGAALMITQLGSGPLSLKD